MSGKQPARPPKEFKPSDTGQAKRIPAEATKLVKKFKDIIRDKKQFKYVKDYINKYLDEFKLVVNIDPEIINVMTKKFNNDKDFIGFLENYGKYGIIMETLLISGVPDIMLNKSDYSPILIPLFDNNLLYVKALQYRDSNMINALHNNNVNIQCFTTDFVNKYNECRKNRETKKKCIQGVIDDLFDKNMELAFNGNPNLHCIDLLLQIDREYIRDRLSFGGMKLTPLGIAIHTKNIPLATLLLKFKPDLNELFNTKGTVPERYLDVLVKNGHLDMLLLLKNKGGITRKATGLADFKVLLDKAKNNQEIYNELTRLR